jgi:hypothetical protein
LSIHNSRESMSDTMVTAVIAIMGVGRDTQSSNLHENRHD